VDFVDPLKVLEEVIGKPLREFGGQDGASQDDGAVGKPAELVEDIDFHGLRLHDFLEHENDGIDGVATRNSATQIAEECEYV